MRIRMLHPEFFSDVVMAELSPLTRLVFIGLWCLADREGRLPDNEKQIGGALLPFERGGIGKSLRNLEAVGRIVRYATNRGPAIQIVNFLKYQHVHPKEKPSIFPGPTTGSNGKISGPDPSASTSTSTSTSRREASARATGAPPARPGSPIDAARSGVGTSKRTGSAAPGGRAGPRAASAADEHPALANVTPQELARVDAILKKGQRRR